MTVLQFSDEVDRFSAQDGIQLDIKETQMGYATTKDNTVDSTTSIPIAELRGFCRSNCFQEGPLYIEFDVSRNSYVSSSNDTNYKTHIK